MNTDLLYKFNKKLNTLHDLLSTIIPVNKLTIHPIEYFNNEYLEIFKCLEELINKSKNEQERLKEEGNNFIKEIQLVCTNLNIEEPEIPKFNNYNLRRDYLHNELENIRILEKDLSKEINLWISKILEIHCEIYSENLHFDKIKFSKDFLINLKNMHKRLKKEKEEKEAKRGEMVKQLKIFFKRLEILDCVSMSSRLSEIEEKYDFYRKICLERENELKDIMDMILKKEDLLKIPNTHFTNSLSDRYINILRDRANFLDEEYKRRIDEIYNAHCKNLQDLLSLFGMEDEIYEKSDKGLFEMKNKIKDLELKKDLYLEICNMIERRYSLLESMNEFEKIASDPKRLFKSSFQLNREENFRKCAFPSLLKIESEILEKINEYSKSYGSFYKDGKDFESELKKEIEGRIINKTVFINKFDSPYKKKKM